MPNAMQVIATFRDRYFAWFYFSIVLIDWIFIVRKGPRLRFAFNKVPRCGILSKFGSDLGLVSRVKELLRGSRTGCQYR